MSKCPKDRRWVIWIDGGLFIAPRTDGTYVIPMHRTIRSCKRAISWYKTKKFNGADRMRPVLELCERINPASPSITIVEVEN